MALDEERPEGERTRQEQLQRGYQPRSPAKHDSQSVRNVNESEAPGREVSSVARGEAQPVLPSSRRL